MISSSTTNTPASIVPSPAGVSAAALIAGRAVPGEAHELPDPATGETVARAGWALPGDVDEAVAAAATSRTGWGRTPPRERAAALTSIAEGLKQRVAELADLIVQETGKRHSEATGEVLFSARYFEWFAEVAVSNTAQYIPTPERRFLVRHEPVGVVAAVAPWNFPLSIPARKVAAALAAGCPVVLKPSELTPRSGLALVAIASKFLPSGVINAVVGDGELITNALIDNKEVAAVTFTGSTQVGALVGERAMRSMTRVVLELGGKAPFVITEDVDVDAAVAALMIAKFRNNGASCIGANNVFVHQTHYRAVVRILRERFAAMVVGDPADARTDLGPVIRATHVDRLNKLVDDARGLGAAVSEGDVPSRGWFVAPTLIEAGGHSVAAWDEEIFGPVCVVRPFGDIDAVVQEINAWPLGLAGYVMGADQEAALTLAERLRVGVVGINNGAPNSPEIPFGGFGLSGIGREGGLAGMQEFLEAQSISVAR